MQPHTIGLTTLVALASGVIGYAIQQRLASLDYRQNQETLLPTPGPRHWIPAATAIAAGMLTLRYHTTGTLYWLLPTLPIAIFGPWLAAIDIDVLRLPTRLIRPLAATIATGIAAAAIIAKDPNIAIRGYTGGLAVLLLFRLIYRITQSNCQDLWMGVLCGLSIAS
ncbi:MAG: hypothetical protein QM286_03775 [Acidobacteriota bacterium]|nr:hypothetical protein [Acidobacteriota bacterium]